jgi:hypothetical protein
MPRDPNILALARCGRDVIASTNGHGRRWAAERCIRALVAGGTPLFIAAQSAQAMVVVAQGIAAAAAAAATQGAHHAS